MQELAIDLKVTNASEFDHVIAQFETSPPPTGFRINVSDKSSRGAFDSEWLIGLLVSFPVGVAGNLIAAWLWERLKASKSQIIVILPDEREIDIEAPDAQAALKRAVEERLKGR